MDPRSLEVIEQLNKFSIGHLDNAWIREVIDSDFTEAPDLPIEFEEIHASTNFVGLFKGIKDILRQWVDTISTTGEDQNENPGRRLSFSFLSTSSICGEDLENRDKYSLFWDKTTKSVNVNGLLCLLFYYIHRGQRYDANDETREIGILASGFYFLLLSVPGSNAFRIFHPILYLKSLDILRLTTKLNVGASPKKAGRISKSNQRRSDDLYGEEDEDGDLAVLTAQEANKLIRLLNILLNDFLRLTQRFSLKHSPESLEETLTVLVDVTRCETHNAFEVFIGRHGPTSSTFLAYNAYVCLQNICIPLHGNIKKTVTLIMKNLLPNILMTARGSSDVSARALNVIREHTVVFVKYLLFQIKEEAHDGVYILLQHLCLQVPDKADFREKAAKSIVEVLKTLPLNWHTRFLKWVYKFSHNEKAGHRLFTLEVISKLLLEDERSVDNKSPTSLEHSMEENEENRPTSNEEMHQENLSPERMEEENQPSCSSKKDYTEISSIRSIPTDHSAFGSLDCQVLSHKFLLSIIFSRCRDSAATVRSKSLSLLASCFTSQNSSIIQSISEIFFKESRPDVFTTPHIEGEINCESPQQEPEDSSLQIELPNARRILSLLRRRTLDDKVTVRKSALQVMENLMKLDKDIASLKDMEILVRHCRDPALLIRKQVLTSLTNIVEMYPENESMIKLWVSGIMPLILDPEIKVQERVVEVTNGLLFSRIMPYQMTSEAEKLPWKILSAITDLSYHKFLVKILMMWSKSDLSRPRIVASVQTHVNREFDEQAWMLLAQLSQFLPIKDLRFALDYFDLYSSDPNQVGSYTLQQVLKVLSHGISHIPGNKALELRERLLESVGNFSLNVELITPMIDTVTIITYKLEGQDEAGQKAIEDWAVPILKQSDEFLKKMLFPKKTCSLAAGEEESLFRHIFTIGELWMLCPKIENKRLFLLMQSIIFHETHITPSSGPPTKIPSTQTQSSQPPAVTFTPTSRLKSVAVVTLGKMCLQHENQAKRIVPALARLLESTTLPELRNNILFVLSDMCVRYATLVDPLMPQVTACLMDSDIKVRRTTLTLLISLLQEDYLKLKGSFFYRILQCLCDDHEDIRNTVVFFMTERLLKRFPKIFLQHFIECIFHYNCYEEHESYNRFVQSKKEKELFSLAGSDLCEKRMFLYRFMLEHMPDDQRFSTTHRLCQDILGGIVDGRIKLTPSSIPMIEDTLMVLSSEEIKLASLKTRPEDADQPTDQAEQAAMAGQVIKKTLISQFVKRNVIENIIPILTALKQRLEEKKSPLMKQLLLYFKEIMKDYKNEVKEILAGDKQLAKEIEFDLRKLEQAQLKEKEERRRQREEIQEQATLEAEQNRSSERRPVTSLGNSPKLRVPSELPAIEEEQSSPADSDSKPSTSPQWAEEEEKVVEGNQEEPHKTSADDSNGRESINSPSPSQSLIRRKSTGNELLKKALINSKKLSHRKSLTAAISIRQQEQDAMINMNENAESGDGKGPIPYVILHRLKLEPSTQADEPMPQSDKDAEVPMPQFNQDTEMPKSNQEAKPIKPKSPEFAAPPPKSIQRDDAGKSFQPLLSIPEEFTRDPSPPPPVIQTRQDLLRAISTPQGQKVIDNITFINKSQEISCIPEISDVSLKENADKSKTLLLHFRSPEAFGKDEEFSQLRRQSKRSLMKDFGASTSGESQKGTKGKPRGCKTSKQAPSTPTNRQSGGFMESFESRHNENSENSGSLMSSSIDQSTLDGSGRTSGAQRRRSKRTRQAASLSPLVDKNKNIALTPSSKKTSPKRPKRKGKR